MSIQDKFNLALRKWSETFIQRSMHESVRFSKESGLSMGQLTTLFRLYHGGICGVSDLGDHLGVTNAAASQMVDKLVQQGYWNEQKTQMTGSQTAQADTEGH
jgi:DNA-binding MarR family transcriptional regulator